MTTHLFKNKSIYSTKTLCFKKEKHKYQLGIFILMYSLISFSVFGFQTDPSGTIEKSYSVGEVSAKNNAGGLVGRNVNATIQISFTKSNVNRTEGSDENFGGFIGSNGDEENQLAGGNLLYCYSTGAVSYANASIPNHKGFVGKQVGTPSHTANFFDSETSNQTSDLFSSASPASTAEMKQVSTFLAEGWKFKADENEWGINAEENEAYPFLRWEDINAENIWLGSQSSNANLATNWSEASLPTSTSAIRIPSKAASNNTHLEVNSNLEIASLFIENEDGNLVVLPTKSIKVNGNITNNGQITFKSDATGDAYFDEFSGSISGTGDIVVEKYYPAKRAFRMVTSTVNSTTSIYDNWQNGGLNQGDTGFEAGIGTHITGSATGANGFDQTETGNPSLFYFDNGWQAIPNTNATNLTAGTPYRLMIRGDRDPDLLIDNDATPSTTTLIATGELEVGAVTEEFPSATAGSNTFAFIANPYQSRIDVSSLLSNNSNAVDAKYWVWDPMINTRGGFVLVSDNNNTWGLTPSDTNNTSAFSTVPKFIEPGQAFFIELSGTDSNISFTESVKDVTTTIPTSQSLSNNQMSMLLSLQNEESQIIDGIRLRFAADGISEIDAADIAKMSNIDENLASVNENSLFTVQRRNFPENEEEIPLFTNNWRKENYSFVANLSNLDGTNIYLVDAYLGTETLLNDGEAYSFSVDASVAASVDTQRFSLKFDNVTMSIEDLENNLMNLYPNPAQEVVNIQTNLALGTQVDVAIYNLLGQQVYAKQQELKSATLQVDVNRFNSGVYMVKLTDEAGSQYSHKLIKR